MPEALVKFLKSLFPDKSAEIDKASAEMPKSEPTANKNSEADTAATTKQEASKQVTAANSNEAKLEAIILQQQKALEDVLAKFNAVTESTRQRETTLAEQAGKDSLAKIEEKVTALKTAGILAAKDDKTEKAWRDQFAANYDSAALIADTQISTKTAGRTGGSQMQAANAGQKAVPQTEAEVMAAATQQISQLLK